ncbi:NDR1/HIN1-like protein 13 [Zingiber officinale]|uniref:NDR1/HIN1-like protein 13 n=1 Tax=Zingiber officinale TaxID=94328 RepID=UPI001C4B30E2|nr:NDR1/HIN1-like protein 13 [Zingiber officinale]
MFSDRVHPHSPPSQERSLSPRSSDSSSQSFIPKLPPPPGHYVIQVKKDLILRVPPPEDDRRVSLYARRSDSRRRSLLCFLASAVASLSFILFLVAVIILYFVCHPKEPVISIDALYVRNFNLSAAALSPEFVATFRAVNPNKRLGIHYLSGGEVTASYGGVKLGDGAWPDFFQELRNVTVFDADLTASGFILSSAILQDLAAAEKRRQVPLLVDASVPVQFKAGAITSWTIIFKLRCDVIVDRLTPASKIISESCGIEMQI